MIYFRWKKVIVNEMLKRKSFSDGDIIIISIAIREGVGSELNKEQKCKILKLIRESKPTPVDFRHIDMRKELK